MLARPDNTHLPRRPVGIENGSCYVDAARLAGNRGRLALAYLARQNERPVSRAEPAEILWGEAVTQRWERALSAIVSKLHGARPRPWRRIRHDVRFRKRDLLALSSAPYTRELRLSAGGRGVSFSGYVEAALRELLAAGANDVDALNRYKVSARRRIS